MIKRFQRGTMRDGFIDGFTSSFFLFHGNPKRFSYRNQDSVRLAWLKVGKELAKATRIEGDRIGKTSSAKQGDELVHN